jgi:hypothetical protein
MRFINDDVKLKHGGRKAARMHQNELLDMIVARSDKAIDKMDVERCKPDDKICASITNLLEYDTVVYEDNRACSIEHMYLVAQNNDYMHSDKKMNDIGHPLLGLHTLENGLTFLGFISWDDWHLPAFRVLYCNGKNIRMYAPCRGNFVDVERKCGISTEEKYCIDDSVTTYIHGKHVNNLHYFPCWADSYLGKYGYSGKDDEKLGFNWDAIQQDIEACIEIA